MKGQDQLSRIACAIVFSDRRVGESYRDAAMRALQLIEQEGREGVTAEQVLTWACMERADRLFSSRVKNNRDAALDELLEEVMA